MQSCDWWEVLAEQRDEALGQPALPQSLSLLQNWNKRRPTPTVGDSKLAEEDVDTFSLPTFHTVTVTRTTGTSNYTFVRTHTCITPVGGVSSVD
jgi:hypothetical protein